MSWRLPMDDPAINHVFGNVTKLRTSGDKGNAAAGTPSGARKEPRDSVRPGGSLQRDANRQHALDALHNYIVEFVDFDHQRAALVLARVTHVLDQHLAATPRAEPGGYAS